MKSRHLSFILFLLFSTIAHSQTQTVTYQESFNDFVNPDRGFYYPIYTTTDPVLDAATLTSLRENAFTPFQGNYQVRVSLIFRYYVLEDFKNSNIPQSFLNNMQADFVALRAAGMRVIPRFAYDIAPDTSCGAAACPPYGDVQKSRVLAHIAQIKPLLQTNSDVISTAQMGFIGVWGEGYYTDHFGDPSPNGQGQLFNSNWRDRNEVLAAILDAVPNNRLVQVRYPQIKQKYIYGVNAPVTSAPLTASEAHQGTDKSRIGFHNDCFLASPDDFGTYFDYGSDNNTPSNQIGILKPYFSNDSKFVAVGGETCSDEYSPQNNCPNAGIAISEMENLNYSFLNSDFNNTVNNDWQSGGCMNEIKRRLGYRFVLKNGTYPRQATAGETINFTINFKNVGFAAPFNERILRLVFKNINTGQRYIRNISGDNVDTRFWHPSNQIPVNGSVSVPSNLPSGNYQLFLHIADPSDNNRIIDRPEYSIRLGNQGVWDNSTGYNDLKHNITIFSTTCASGNLNLTGTINSTQVYKTSRSITSTQKINPSANVTYTAQNSISLKTGFEARLGTQFRATIEGCTTNVSNIVENRTHSTEQPHPTMTIFPNPFIQEVNISLDIPQADYYTLTVYDVLGRTIMQPLQHQWLDAGIYQQPLYNWHNAGTTYFFVLQSSSIRVTRMVQQIKK